MSAPLTPRRFLVSLAICVGAASFFASAASAEALQTLDYETGNLTQWKAVQAKAGRITVVSDPVRQGSYAARFVVKPGDVPVGTHGERAEVLARTSEKAGVTSHWHWSTLFPGDFKPSPGSFNVFTQWHHDGSKRGCGPPVLFRVNTRPTPRLQLSVSGGKIDSGCKNLSNRTWDLGPLVLNSWYDFDFTVTWSASAGKGSVALSVNGDTVVPKTSLATLYDGYGVYVKQGYYRADANFSTVVFHDAMVRD
jgi:hypothetical protein